MNDIKAQAAVVGNAVVGNAVVGNVYELTGIITLRCHVDDRSTLRL